VAVVNMQQRVFGSIDYAALEAGVTLLALPCVLLFLILQRGYVRGFMSGSLRG
jgi:multiple sugar transport system permease protein